MYNSLFRNAPSHLAAILLAATPVAAVAAETSTPRWQLVWADEFDYQGAPDPARWRYEVGMLRNQEAQFYTDHRPENVRVENGSLIIETRKEDWRDAHGKMLSHYTSGSLHTLGTAQWRYGRMEVRAQLPTGRGMWPAIWLLGAECSRWPACGEIDIMENVGFDPYTIHGTIHCTAYNFKLGNARSGTVAAERPWARFHVYALEWTPKHIDFFVDEQRYFRYVNDGGGNDTWPFDKAFYLKLNTAVGGSWGGAIDDRIFPQRFYIDYVRVYQAADN